MGKTFKGEKGSGWDRWDRIANSGGKYHTVPGKFQKNQNVRKERRNGKNQIDLFLNKNDNLDENN